MTLLLFERKRRFSSFATPDFKKQQNRNKTSLKNKTKFTRIFVFIGDEIINTPSIEKSNQINAGTKDETHKIGIILQNQKKKKKKKNDCIHLNKCFISYIFRC